MMAELIKGEVQVQGCSMSSPGRMLTTRASECSDVRSGQCSSNTSDIGVDSNVDSVNEGCVEGDRHNMRTSEVSIPQDGMMIVNNSITSSTATNSLGKPRRKVDPTPNDSWKEVLKLIEPYLDVESMLSLRCCATLFYRHKYKPHNNILHFASLRGFAPKTVIEVMLPAASRAVSVSTRQNLRLDFSGNTLFRDGAVARLMDAVHGDSEANIILGNLTSLNLSYCYSITDKGLAALLTTHLPSLESLTLKCARSKHLTGQPFSTELTEKRWPRFVHFDCSFTNTWLDPCETVACFIIDRAAATSQNPRIEIAGSWASRCLFDRLSKGPVWNAFCSAVKNSDEPSVAKLTKLMQQEFLEMEEPDYPLWNLVKSEGSKLLVNAPMNVDSQMGDRALGETMSLWTLPVIVALRNGDSKLFNTFLRRGAFVDVWDHFGVSLACHACELREYGLIETLFTAGASPMPYDLGGQSALEEAIKQKDINLIELLLKHGAVLNIRCPAFRQYKSPLYIACELYAVDGTSDIINLLLEAGADPNWKSHTKFTPTMLAYQSCSSWLKLFLEAGAGSSDSTRWVLTEVLGCAVMKNDMASVKLLCTAHPDLLSRGHLMWNKPHVQAAKLGRVDILDYLLSAGADTHATGNNGQTALHDASEGGYVECVKLLLARHAEINVVDADGHTPLHLACLENRQDVAQVLLSGGDCNLALCDRVLGETPLMICIRTRNTALCQVLAKFGRTEDCDVVDKQGRSALTYAIFFGQYSVADFLMACGASLTLTDDAGNSPYSIVCERLLNQGSDKRVLKKYLRLYKTLSKNKKVEKVVPKQAAAAAAACSNSESDACSYNTVSTPIIEVDKLVGNASDSASDRCESSDLAADTVNNPDMKYNNQTQSVININTSTGGIISGKTTNNNNSNNSNNTSSLAVKFSKKLRPHLSPSKISSTKDADDSTTKSKNNKENSNPQQRAMLSVAKLPMALFRAAAKAK